MKVGQMASITKDVLPKKLVMPSPRFKAPPMSFDIIAQQIESELGAHHFVSFRASRKALRKRIHWSGSSRNNRRWPRSCRPGQYSWRRWCGRFRLAPPQVHDFGKWSNQGFEERL